MAKTEKAPELVPVKIWRGQVHDKVDGEPVIYRPGDTYMATPEEAAQLKERGFVRPDEYKPPEEVQDGQVKISPAEGATVTNITPAA